MTVGPSPRRRRLLGHYDYPTSYRVLEVVSSVVFLAMLVAVVVRTVDAFRGRADVAHAVVAVMIIATAFALADLLSGVVHFLFDTFGTPDTPVIGQKFVKPFRDHHDDPLAMTRDDAIAVNADNLFVCLPVLAVALAVGGLRDHPEVGTFVLALVIAVALTNQFHKWAHTAAVPRPVAFAQRHGLILGVEHHRVHHTAPFDRHHCITFGRMDVLLDVLTARWRPPTGSAPPSPAV